MNRLAILLVVLLVLPSVVPVNAEDGPVTKDYGDYTLPDGAGYQFETWNLNKGPVTVTYELDLSGAPNVAHTGSYGQSGQVGLIWWDGGPAVAGALMSGFLADWDNASTEFPTYPDKDGTLDLDDKFNLQRFPYPGSWSETEYDVVFGDPTTVHDSSIGSGSNYGIWFDRDGVDQYQASGWGAVDGGTYNTDGVYKVQLTFTKLNATTGVVQPLFFPALANDDAPGGYGVPTGFNRLTGGGYQYFPAGISFQTDETKMAAMRVLVQGSPGNGSMVIRDLQVTGYPSDTPVTTEVVANPAPMSGSAQVSAIVESKTDVPVGFAEYSLDGGTTWALLGDAWVYDELIELVTGTVPVPPTPGIYPDYVCVRGVDNYWNRGEPACTMLVVYDPDGGFVTGGGWIDSPAGAYKLGEPVPLLVWDQGFETSTDGWFDSNSEWYGTATRVESGDGGVASSSGAYHAIFEGDADSAPFSRFDGYRDTWYGSWTAEVDVYLDPAWEAGVGFDYTVAASGSDGEHQRDYIFHVTKDTSTGALLVAGSNNTNFAPREDLENINHYTVGSAGWYTFQHVFRQQDGALAVDLNLLDADGNLLLTETRFNTADLIPDEVGGNRYGWFCFINVPDGIAVDEHQLLFPEKPDPTGKANFGFVSKYKKGADVPTGNTEFVFQAADLNFHSTSYDWLLVTGKDYAKFKGSGTINGEGDYKFMLWAGDGDPDTFRIRIWEEDELTGAETDIYDNGADQPIGGGNIVVHTK